MITKTVVPWGSLHDCLCCFLCPTAIATPTGGCSDISDYIFAGGSILLARKELIRPVPGAPGPGENPWMGPVEPIGDGTYKLIKCRGQLWVRCILGKVQMLSWPCAADNYGSLTDLSAFCPFAADLTCEATNGSGCVTISGPPDFCPPRFMSCGDPNSLSAHIEWQLCVNGQAGGGVMAPVAMRAAAARLPLAEARPPCQFLGPSVTGTDPDRRWCELYDQTTHVRRPCGSCDRTCAGCPGYQPPADQ